MPICSVCVCTFYNFALCTVNFLHFLNTNYLFLFRKVPFLGLTYNESIYHQSNWCSLTTDGLIYLLWQILGGFYVIDLWCILFQIIICLFFSVQRKLCASYGKKGKILCVCVCSCMYVHLDNNFITCITYMQYGKI